LLRKLKESNAGGPFRVEQIYKEVEIEYREGNPVKVEKET